jgi:hypothetical protein
MARAPVSKTGGCRFESCHSCQLNQALSVILFGSTGQRARPLTVLFVGALAREHLVNIRLAML